MNQTQRQRIYYSSLGPKSFVQLYQQMLQDAVISEVHKICDGLHFLEIRDMSGIFSNLANLYRT